jgi:hypothetical protein
MFFLFLLGSAAPAFHDIPHMPAAARDAFLCSYVAWLSTVYSPLGRRQGKRLAYRTITTYLSAVSTVFFLASGVSVTKGPGGVQLPGLKYLKRALKKEGDSVFKMRPLPPDMLRHVVHVCLAGDYYVVGIAIAVAWFFLLRVSESCVTPQYPLFDPQRQLAVDDVLFFDKDGAPIEHSRFASGGDGIEAAYRVQLGIAGSKTDWSREGCLLTHHRVVGDWLCPVQLLGRAVRVAVDAEYDPTGPLYRTADGSALSSELLVTVLRAALASFPTPSGAPLNVFVYASHSLRSGGATALFAADKSCFLIKLMGRWLSSCFEEYIHLLPRMTIGAAAAMVGCSADDEREHQRLHEQQ